MDDTIKDDVLVGAEAIAAYLGINRRQVYRMRESNHPALKNEPGLGIVARKSFLARIGTSQPEAAE